VTFLVPILNISIGVSWYARFHLLHAGFFSTSNQYLRAFGHLHSTVSSSGTLSIYLLVDFKPHPSQARTKTDAKRLPIDPAPEQGEGNKTTRREMRERKEENLWPPSSPPTKR
jgi:hypothetical protein